MAQLPPKVPNMTPNWPDFPHQRMASIENFPPNNPNHSPSWMDDFLDFSAEKRGSHRRSISDSIAFIEPPMADECRRQLAPGSRGGNEFDRFDDDQFMSMFVDDVVGPTKSLSNTSTPSDHHSMNEEKSQPLDHHNEMMILKNEPEEVDSSCKMDGLDEDYLVANNSTGTNENSSDKIVDPKRVKRILANRQSAQRSRVRKLQYISELERSVTSLQAEVSLLSPRVAFLDHQRLVLTVDNSAIKQRMAALAQDKIFKDAHQEALRKEIERLRKVYQDQNLKKMDNNQHDNATHPSPIDANGTKENQQLVN